MILTSLLGLGSAQAASLQVSVSNSILSDLVRNVGGERMSINEIVPTGVDPHTFQPSASVIRRLVGSRVLFINGAGLEPWLPQVRASAPSVPARTLTSGLKLREGDEEEGEDHVREEHSDFDPHAWWDLGLAAGYVRNIQATLSTLDPAGKADYVSNTTTYLKKLSEADVYAKRQFATLPASKHQIVTNHDALNYFAARYGLKLVGAVIPGLSTEREPSARELATLITTVKQSGAKVIFTENTVDTRLAQALAKETGARIAPPLYTDALGPRGSSGETFLKAFRFNLDQMIKELK
nr:zinc ABC transporter substrate-binding protein [Deinococcus humi]